MNQPITLLLVLCLLAIRNAAAEFHVAEAGNDAHDGSVGRPFKTITAAARVAQPGDVITVHAGVYRERVSPPRGGESAEKRIVYQAAPGEEVVIKGSEAIRQWVRFAPGVWKVTLPNSFFGAYNPYKDLIVGDWFDSKGRSHHTGEVFFNGKSLWEAALLERVINPSPHPGAQDPQGSTWTWFCESDEQNTYIYANFHDKNPNAELAEITVRESCFYPDQPGRNYITVHGFRMSQAATQWAAPTAEQIGLIGTHWSKGWIIEHNVISDSKCAGITLGKDRQIGHNLVTNDPGKDGATHYNEVITRALAAGWSRETIGSHLVRYNTVFNCEQAGICGSLGGIFSEISNNHIYDIWTKRQFTGAEIAGIKIHAAIDVLIAQNRVNNCERGIWLDWMAQGTRVTRNLCYENPDEDIYMEANHGPFLVDNNLLLSTTSLRDRMSEGGAYAHNLFAGRIVVEVDRGGGIRITPHFQAHSTSGLTPAAGQNGDDRFANNLFVGRNPTGDPVPGTASPSGKFNQGLAVFNGCKFPLQTSGNVYVGDLQPYEGEAHPVLLPFARADIQVQEVGGQVVLRGLFDAELTRVVTTLVTTATLGTARLPPLLFENADGSPLSISTDYFGLKRDPARPLPGPFENLRRGDLALRVW